MDHLAELSFEADLHRLLKCTVDLLKMEDFVLELLNLIDVTEVLRV